MTDTAQAPIVVMKKSNATRQRRTRVIGTFPDGNSALMLACAMLRGGEGVGTKQYLCTKYLTETDLTSHERST